MEAAAAGEDFEEAMLRRKRREVELKRLQLEEQALELERSRLSQQQSGDRKSVV